MHIIDLFKRHKRGIIFAISLVIIENIAWIIEPTFFGQVIDAIFDEDAVFYSYDWWYGIIIPLSWWTAMFLINSGVGSIRRFVDPRIFMKIFADIGTSVAAKSIEKDYSVSKTTARAQLSYEYIIFFEFRMPEIIENVIEKIIIDEDQKFLGWRDVPVDLQIPGKGARATQPYIKQCFIGANKRIESQDELKMSLQSVEL